MKPKSHFRFEESSLILGKILVNREKRVSWVIKRYIKVPIKEVYYTFERLPSANIKLTT